MTRLPITFLLFLPIIGCSPAPGPDPQSDDVQTESLQIQPMIFSPLQINDDERTALGQLHRSAVSLFVERPGFGGGRVMQEFVIPVEEDVAFYPVENPQKKEIQRIPLVRRHNDGQIEEHLSFRDQLNKTNPSVLTIQGVGWKLQDVQLIGLVVHPQPVAYDGKEVPGMKSVQELSKRPLNSFENLAIDRIRNSERYPAEIAAGEIHFVAPIYAGNRCLKCHEQPGQLLGAFSYVLKPVEPQTGAKSAAP